MGEFRQRDPAADRRMAETPSLAKYFPSLLRYPVSGHALPALLGFAVLLWVSTQSIMGIGLLAIVSPWVFHYAEAVIDLSARGQATAPMFGGNMIFLANLSALRPLVGVALLALPMAWAGATGNTVALVELAVAGTLVFPAFLLILAIDNSMVAALNPLRWLQVMAAVGPVYLGVCLVLALSAAIAIVSAGAVVSVLSFLILIYFWIFTCHLLGYIAFHRADKLGVITHVRHTRDERLALEHKAGRVATVLARMDAAITARNLQAAADALYADPGAGLDPCAFHEELFEQLQRRQKPELLHAQGQRLIEALVPAKRVGRALDVAEICFDAHKDFTAPLVVTLAEAARRAGRGGLFERLTQDARARHPADVAVSLEFLCAQYWAEQRRDEPRAREILARLSAETGHAQHRQIVAYARALAGTSA